MKRKLFKIITTSIKKNALPGLVLWIFASSILLLYYFYEPSKAYFDMLSEAKAKYGVFYSLTATAIFAGIIPYIYLVSTGRMKKNLIKNLIFYILFWAERGVEVDLFYTLQSKVFGTENSFKVLASKVLCDQFIYAALIAAPIIAVAYHWKSYDYKFKGFSKTFDKNFFHVQIPSVIITNWLIWIPAVIAIYSLPLPLQISMFNFVICFWVLLVEILNKESEVHK
ncbi:MAG: hypothetical protein PF692_13575 [Kiritimatiellae bacterium]|jgi:hypothetical protein|nr:hypothetical protein [Kiritimatiellia bacterium]